jgi:TolB protein
LGSGLVAREELVSITAPPRPPRPGDPVERDELEALVEALIEEARRRARRRRLMYAAVAASVVFAGVVVFAAFDHTAQSRSASPAQGALPAFPGAAGSRIAFMRGPTGPGQWAVYVMNADGTRVRRLASSSFNQTWSPDGRRIAVQSERNGGYEIDVMNADGGARRTLTWRGIMPAWSPDGRTIAFSRQEVGGNEIYATNVDGRKARRLATNGVRDELIGWSPDARKLVFVGSTRDGNSEVYVVNADGGAKQRLTRSSGFEHHPAWSPDGTRIAFTRTLGDRVSGVLWSGEIYVMNADGSDLQRLSGIVQADYTLAWSPDGSRLVFVGYRSGSNGTHGDGIYVVNADGGRLRKLTGNVGKEPIPSWSPDGRKIAFTGRDESIYVIGADGHGMKRLTHARQRIDWAPAWSPVQARK